MCHEKKKISFDVVRDFDLMEGGDPMTPPMFPVKLVEEKWILSIVKGTWSRVQAFRFAGNKKGLSEMGFLTQYF